jgi:hypothetical protein
MTPDNLETDAASRGERRTEGEPAVAAAPNPDAEGRA